MRNRQWYFPGISVFQMVDFRLTSYLKLTGVSYWPPPPLPPIVERHIIGQWDASKKRTLTETLQNHAYIRQLVLKLMKLYFQASVGYTCYLLFINQGAANSVRSVQQVCQFISIYLCQCISIYLFIYANF